VPDARYVRSQADFCLQMALQVGARKDADNFRAMAAKYNAQADALENGSEPSWSFSKAPEG
jgi:hypothetical protein